MLALSVEARFHSELLGLPRDAQKKVTRALRELQRDPTHLSEPLKGSEDIWRCRVGSYRILFVTQAGWIHVYSVQHRAGVYAAGVAMPGGTPTSAAIEFPPLVDKPATEQPQVGGNALPLFDEERLRAEGLSEELVAGILECQEASDLLDLIDLGLPDHLFNELAVLIGRGDRVPIGGVKQVELIRRDVIDQFFRRVIGLPSSRRVLELTIVAPWITPWKGRESSLKAVLKFARINSTRMTIITRPPEFAAHVDAIQQLRSSLEAEIVYLPQLHAKFFICEIAPSPFALVGSANATTQSLANFELGVLVRGSGPAEGFVRDLQGLAVELRSFGKRAKKRGAK